jgi:hypothetical protein
MANDDEDDYDDPREGTDAETEDVDSTLKEILAVLRSSDLARAKRIPC